MNWFFIFRDQQCILPFLQIVLLIQVLKSFKTLDYSSRSMWSCKIVIFYLNGKKFALNTNLKSLALGEHLGSKQITS